jgi:hypothetical protein
MLTDLLLLRGINLMDSGLSSGGARVRRYRDDVEHLLCEGRVGGGRAGAHKAELMGGVARPADHGER